MLVCAHGDVEAFCRERGMIVCGVYEGRLEAYAGEIRVIVTDSDMPETEYYYLKGMLLIRGYELISTRYSDNKTLSEYLVYANARRKAKYTGRRSFSDTAVIQRIRELNAAGVSLRKIRETDGVSHPDGRKLSISTISKIIKNIEKEK